MGRLVGVALVCAVILAGCDGQRSKAQHRYAETLRPRGLLVEPDRAKPIRRYRLRVYATEEYRSKTLHWREKFDAQVERANQVLGPRFGAVLEVVDTLAWAPPG